MAAGSTTLSNGVGISSVPKGAVVVLGRVLFALIFLAGGASNFAKQKVAEAVSAGVPLASVLVPISGLIALAGGLSILLGYRTQVGAWLIALFLATVTPTMHKFWGITDPVTAQTQMAQFLKNISMLGSALLISQFGAGPLSLDARRVR
jgi:putative oxidoreductase